MSDLDDSWLFIVKLDVFYRHSHALDGVHILSKEFVEFQAYGGVPLDEVGCAGGGGQEAREVIEVVKADQRIIVDKEVN